MTSRDSPDRAARVCANAPCPRSPESGETLCEACGIEHSLFRREERARPATALPGTAPRRVEFRGL